VIGFNVRPLARSAKLAGFQVLAVDYWGDLDLSLWADRYIAMLDQQPDARPDRPLIPTAQLLTEGAEQILLDHGAVQHILVGGGFDDSPEEWAALSDLGPLAGNTPTLVQSARDRKGVAYLAQRCGAELPAGESAKSKKTFRNAVARLALPVVVKPEHGSGGFYTKVLRTEEEVNRYAMQHAFDSVPVVVQELIVGTDASVSVLGTGPQACTVSVNEQLIGRPELGRGRTKAYCGNVIPLQADPTVITGVAAIAEEMTESLGLIGSNGFDFVVTQDGTPYFMEINPRFQATIEAIELSTNVNQVRLHLAACQGQLPDESPPHLASCARIIVYAQQRCIIPDLSYLEGVVDIPIPGSHANPGDPVCTVNHVAPTHKAAVGGAWQMVESIYTKLQPLPTDQG
jgi:predicted ATP-grasp superfamily ATP-dependent carboligase